MPRMNEYQHYLLQEFVDEYHEHHMSRRDLIRRAVLIMGTAPAAAAALISLGCGTSNDETPTATTSASGSSPAATSESTAASSATASGATASPPPGSPVANDLRTEDISIPGPGSTLLGYLAQPADAAKSYPGVLVIHENRGLNEHTKDIARRYANEGFVALAVDLVSRKGGSHPTDTAANTGALGSAVIADLIADMKAYATYVQGLEGVRANGIGVTGFCFGGGYSFDTAFNASEVTAAVPYYGTCRTPNALATTKVAFHVMYGGNDGRITGEAATVRSQLEMSGTPFEVQIYDGANHAFFNDTGTNYNEAAAKDAWEKTLAWFREHLPAA